MGRKRTAGWLAEIFYEDNEQLGRRASHLTGLVAKVVTVVPHLFALAFTNFAARYPKVQAASPPEPRELSQAQTVTLETWPRHQDTEDDRGLPFSDSVVARMALGHSLAGVSDLVFAMSEVHRVCAPNASVSLQLVSLESAMADPLVRRPVLRETIRFFTDELEDENLKRKALACGASSMFSIESAETDRMVLRIIKSDAVAQRPTRIDLGCGTQVRDGFTGVDRLPLPGVAILRDVDRRGLPFSDSVISHVWSAHFLEHVRHLVFVMNEIHRVCCHDAVVEISVPTLLGPYAAADPTHVRLFNARTFSYFEKGTEAYAGITKGFEILEQQVGFSLAVRLRVVKPGQDEGKEGRERGTVRA